MQLQVLLGKLAARQKKENEPLQFEKILTEEEIKEIENSTLDISLGTKDPDEVFIFKTHFRNPLGHKNDEYLLVYNIKNVDNTEYDLYVGAKKGETSEKLYFDSVYNCFYDRYKFKNEDKGKIDSGIEAAPVGTIHPGNYYLKVRPKNTSISSSSLGEITFKFVVLPSSLSIQDFKEMANDLLNLRTELASAPVGKQSFYAEKKLHSIISDLEKLHRYLKRINNSPKHKIIETYRMINKRKIKRLDEKTTRQISMFPGRENIKKSIRCETNDIFENRIILYVLTLLYKKIEREFFRKIKTNNDRLDFLYEKQNLFLEEANAKINNWYSLDNGIGSFDELNQVLVKIENDKQRELYSYCREIVYDEKRLLELRVTLGRRRNSRFYETNSFFSVFKANNEIILKFDNYYLLDEEGNFPNIKIGPKHPVAYCEFKLKMKDPQEYDCLFLSLDEIRTHEKSIISFSGTWEPNDKFDTVIITMHKFHSVNGVDGMNIYAMNNLYSKGKNRFIKILNSSLFADLELLKLESKNLFLKIKNNKANTAQWNQIKIVDLNRTRRIVDAILGLKIFKGLKIKKEKWKSTQIFTNDRYYSKVAKILKNFDEEFAITEDFTSKEIVLRKADELYEFWILIKMLEILTKEMGWNLREIEFAKKVMRGENLNLKRVINDFFLPTRPLFKLKKTKEGKSLLFCLEHSLKDNNKDKMRLEIHYNDKFKAIYDEDSNSHEIYTQVQPDYVFDFYLIDCNGKIKTNNKGKAYNRQRVYLDAKYRNYTEQGKWRYYADINDVALVKYIERFSVNEKMLNKRFPYEIDALKEITNNKPVAAFIIHSDNDKRFIDFGGSIDSEFALFIKNKYEEYKEWINKRNSDLQIKSIRNFRWPKFAEYPPYHIFNHIFWKLKIDTIPKNEQRIILGRDDVLDVNHLFGAFSMVPSNVNHFRTFMLMVMEYFFKDINMGNDIHLYDYCWQCDGEGVVTKKRIMLNSGFYKYYLQCECGAFWVINHCNIDGHLLIKHKENNYHKYDKDPWYVYCPKCDYKTRIHQMELKMGEIIDE